MAHDPHGRIAPRTAEDLRRAELVGPPWWADQRRAAGFFRDAERAQEVRMSKRDADNAFWARYKTFATTAQAYCSR